RIDRARARIVLHDIPRASTTDAHRAHEDLFHVELEARGAPDHRLLAAECVGVEAGGLQAIEDAIAFEQRNELAGGACLGSVGSLLRVPRRATGIEASRVGLPPRILAAV
ncbi:MAG: hypothetical protein ACK56I_21625, partial [bacterium]